MIKKIARLAHHLSPKRRDCLYNIILYRVHNLFFVVVFMYGKVSVKTYKEVLCTFHVFFGFWFVSMITGI